MYFLFILVHFEVNYPFYFMFILMFSRLLSSWYMEVFQNIINYIRIIGIIVYFLYLLFCIYFVLKWNKNNKKRLLRSSKSSIFASLWNYIKYLTIWFIIWFTSWAQVSFIFYILNDWLNWYELNYDSFSDEFVLFSSLCSFLSVSLIIIASYFIWLSFGKKIVRAFGDLIYLTWLLLPIVTFFIICWYQ